MTTLVVDSSVAGKWVMHEDYSPEALSLLAQPLKMHAPDFVLAEVGSIICKRVRRGQFSSESGWQRILDFRAIEMELHDSALLVPAAYALAARTGCSFYDCLYLGLAIERECKVVTADIRFLNALKGGPLAMHAVWIGDPVL